MTTLAPTIYTRTFPGAAGWLRDVILILLGALFVAALAQIEIPLPFSPVRLRVRRLACCSLAQHSDRSGARHR